LGILRPFFDLKGTLPARSIEAFLLVALEEGLSVGEYARNNPMNLREKEYFLTDKERALIHQKSGN
jgi:hypothetical protein